MTVNRISHLATPDRSDLLSAEIGAQHFETSSKTGSNVGELHAEPRQQLSPAVFIHVSAEGEVCQCGNSLFLFDDRRDVPEDGWGLHQLGRAVHDRSVASVCRPSRPTSRHQALISSLSQQRKRALTLARRRTHISTLVVITTDVQPVASSWAGLECGTNETHRLWNPTTALRLYLLFLFCFSFCAINMESWLWCHLRGKAFSCSCSELDELNYVNRQRPSLDAGFSVRTIGLQPFPLFVYISANSCSAAAAAAHSTAMSMKHKLPGSELVMFSLKLWMKSFEKLPWTMWNVLEGLILEAGRINVSSVSGVAARWAAATLLLNVGKKHTAWWIFG